MFITMRSIYAPETGVIFLRGLDAFLVVRLRRSAVCENLYSSLTSIRAGCAESVSWTDGSRQDSRCYKAPEAGAYNGASRVVIRVCPKRGPFSSS